ncbi:MAG: hypothetical protein CW338_00040 [Clostridiales bacterium]|nr:hypothetical protein [Clostridiales bacterium]
MQPPYDDSNTGWTRVGGSGSGQNMPPAGGPAQPYGGAPSGEAYPVYDTWPAEGYGPGNGAYPENGTYPVNGGYPAGGPAVPPAVDIPPAVDPYGPGYGQQPEQPQEEIPWNERNQTVHQVLDPQGYQMPSTGMQRGRRRRMKPTAVAILCVIAFSLLILIIVGMVSCMGRGCAGTRDEESGYGRITYGNLEATYSGDALVVRNETIFTQNGITGIDYVASEGSRLSRGEHVCTVYTSGFSSKELTTLQRYRDQIKNYHKTLLEKQTVNDTRLISLENVVLARAVEAQTLVQGGKGNLINQEKLLEDSMRDRMVYLKQKFPDDQKLTRLYEDENSQEQKITSWTKQYAATAPGLISFYTDGYENVVNMDTYLTLQPAQVRSMITKVPEDPTLTKNTVSIYRLVKEDRWGVLMLCDNTDWTPEEGSVYQMVIESFENTTVTARVISYTKSGNEMLVRLEVQNASESIGNVLYPRSCHVQLGERVDVLCIPARALYEQLGTTGFVIDDPYWGDGQLFEECQIVSVNESVAYVIPKDKNLEWNNVRVKLREE